MESDIRQLEFQHFIDNLRDAVYRIDSSINLLENNFNNVGIFIDRQLNFRLALGSFVLAIICLIVSFISLL